VWGYIILAIASIALSGVNVGMLWWVSHRKPESIMVSCNCTSHGLAAKEPDSPSSSIADRIDGWKTQSEVSMRRNAALMVDELRKGGV
jgi:hypothetical protein